MFGLRFEWKKAAVAAAGAGLCLALRPDAAPTWHFSLRMNELPRLTMWVWERPEDLRAIDPSTTAVAELDQTILIGPQALSMPRRQPLAIPTETKLISVARIEVLPGGRLDAGAERQVVALLLEQANRGGIAALQVDFDATRSQRAFYATLLSDLRRQMPTNLPLSITALASWCSYDDWIADLPVDEAVPMFFRMEPDRRHAPPDLPQFRIREPLCKTSAGVSTHEAWPSGLAGKRVYVFPDRGWHVDLTKLAERSLP